MYDFVNAGDDLHEICEALERVVIALDVLRKLLPNEETTYQVYSDMWSEALLEESYRLIREADALSRQYEELSL